MSEAAQKAGADIWCYCLMPNHVHIIIVPSDADGLRRTFADAHRRYTGYINTRLECIAHYGACCYVCGFDFSKLYGDELGAGFIHVHHLVDISTIGEEYIVNSIDDLRPLCPNCHSMVHKRKPAIHPDQLKKIIDKNA